MSSILYKNGKQVIIDYTQIDQYRANGWGSKQESEETCDCKEEVEEVIPVHRKKPGRPRKPVKEG